MTDLPIYLRRCASAGLLLLWCLPGFVLAASDGRAAKGELESVRGQRAVLERQLKQTESSRAETADQLRDTEKSISSVGRKLRALEEEHAAAKAELAGRERELKLLERQTAGRQAQLARLLRHAQRAPEADALAILLAGGDPNAAARDRYYLTLLSRAKAELIADLKHDSAETRRLAEAVQQRGDQLAEVAAREESERAVLRQRQQERRLVLEKISRQIEVQRREIDTLKQNEQRLGTLIESLARRPAPPAARPSAKDKGKRGVEPPAVSAAPPENVNFAKLRGQLIVPAKGTIVWRFGSRREDGQSVWKGIFIRAAEGADVRATAAGVVVFADWLRGYGNLVILNHGNELLSVYGNNQSLLVDVGQKVGAGGTVAMVGTGTGGGGAQADSGLYFELRHQGRAFDPMKWLKP